jgi:hypothetical protein
MESINKSGFLLIKKTLYFLDMEPESFTIIPQHQGLDKRNSQIDYIKYPNL